MLEYQVLFLTKRLDYQSKENSLCTITRSKLDQDQGGTNGGLLDVAGGLFLDLRGRYQDACTRVEQMQRHCNKLQKVGQIHTVYAQRDLGK